MSVRKADVRILNCAKDWMNAKYVSFLQSANSLRLLRREEFCSPFCDDPSEYAFLLILLRLSQRGIQNHRSRHQEEVAYTEESRFSASALELFEVWISKETKYRH